MKKLFSYLSFTAGLMTLALPANAAVDGNQKEEFSRLIEVLPTDTEEDIIYKAAHVIPTPRQAAELENEFIGFVHFGPNTFSGREWGTGMEDAVLFNPSEVDTDQWVRVMKDAGMKMVILTAKHHDGYVLWQSRYTDHGIMNSPYMDGQGDVVRDLAEACAKYGMKLGIYLSPADLYQIESPGGYYGNRSEKTLRTIPREVEGRPFESDVKFEFVVDDYNEYYMNQLFELLTEYGPVSEVWLDGANPKDNGQTYDYPAWMEVIRTLAPDAVVFGGVDTRWCGNERGDTREVEWNIIPYQVNPDSVLVGSGPNPQNKDLASREKLKEAKYLRYIYPEVDTSIRHGWFWRDDSLQYVRNADEVFDIYERSVGGNSVLLLNVPPNRDGKFSPRDVKSMEETGKKIRDTYGIDLLKNSNAPAELLDGNWHTGMPLGESLLVTLPEKTVFNRLVLQEPVAESGERIEDFTVEAFVDGKWKEIASAGNIGYKRILRFPDVETDSILIKVKSYRAKPYLSTLSAHRYVATPSSSDQESVSTLKTLPKNNWKATLSGDKGNGSLIIDNDPSTYWITEAESPVILIDLGGMQSFDAMTYTPQTAVAGQGMISKGKLEYSTDGKNWKQAGVFEFGNLVNDPSPRTFYLPSTIEGAVIRITPLEIEGGDSRKAIAEIDLLSK